MRQRQLKDTSFFLREAPVDSTMELYIRVGWVLVSVLLTIVVLEWIFNFWLSSRILTWWQTALGALARRRRESRRRRALQKDASRLEHEIYQFYRDHDDRSS